MTKARIVKAGTVTVHDDGQVFIEGFIFDHSDGVGLDVSVEPDLTICGHSLAELKAAADAAQRSTSMIETERELLLLVAEYVRGRLDHNIGHVAGARERLVEYDNVLNEYREHMYD